MDKGKYKKRGVDYPIIDGLRTLPGKYYHSQEIYEEEVEKFSINFGYMPVVQKRFLLLAIINLFK